MSDEYYEQMSDFYKLEKKYSKNLAKIKKKISESTELSRKQKREKIQALRPKCVNCKKPVGTIFEIKRDYLRAICGANNPNIAKEGYKPCNLDINIKKPELVNLEDIILKIRKEKEALMEKIALDKIKLLYTSSDKNLELETVEQIEQMKLKHREKSSLLENYIKQHLSLMENKKMTKELFLKVFSITKEIIALIEDKRTKDAVELYIDSYIPAIKNETSNKYQEQYIEEVENNYYLHQVSKDEALTNLDVVVDKSMVNMS